MSYLSACDDAARDRYWEAASDAWGRWADAMAAMADKLNQPLLEAAGVCEGARVLDLAGGAGEPAFSSARRVGAGGLSVCTDIAPGMLAGAAARKRPEGAPAVVFSAADMCALPFVAGGFDAVTCRFGVMFVPDVRQALQEAARVLKPGGRAAFMLWGPLADNALFAQISAGVDRVLGPSAPGDALEGLFRFAAPDSFAPLLRAAGFRGVGEQEIRPSRRAKLTEVFWRAPLEMSFSHRLDGLSADRRREVEQSVADRFAETADAEGCVNLPLHIRIVAGQI
jgi:SAM-dependent methyltransferase